ncbi:MAG: hypothetical protein Q8Q17_03280 [bacterium]|nr:hypothetical protein [bacterium]
MPKRRLQDKNFIWTPQLAYAVGLLVTDGNLSKDGRHITMRSSEVELLDSFKNCLGLGNKIGFTEGQRGYRVQFGNIQFYNWLLKIGLFPAKTYTIGKINVPDLYFRDFLRGHLDGDGSILAYVDNYNVYKGRRYENQRIFVRFISASQNHMIWLRQRIEKLADIHGALIFRKPPTENRVPIWELKFAKKESLQLIDWIYYKPDIPCLERKRMVAENAVKIISKQKRREYAKI